ncbi:MAG: hypothetical protein HYR94_20545 [Chloroflexi bacterium]|nr:hypothetical protein [Chloroflexota bacterium]
MKSHPLHYTIILAVILLLGFGQAAAVGAQDQAGNVFIENPANGATVSGLITITGAVTFPDFLKYEIFLKPGKGELLWVATTYAPVIHGNLARFDTRTYMNGTYQMIIRQVHDDSNYTEAVGPTITIDNELGAPLPYPEIEPSYLYPPEKYALVRLKNCSGVSLEFDYNSPQSSRSADTLWLMAKGQDTTYCPFEDFVVIPGEYRGTATGQGEKAFNYSFQAEVGKVYELIYNGEGAAHNQFLVNYVQGDKRASTDTGGGQIAAVGVAAAPTQTPVPVAAAVAPAAAPEEIIVQVAPEEAPARVVVPAETSAESSSILPETGRGDATRLLFILIGTTVVLFLIGGGVLAVIWRRILSS